ncbi:hypothetical protein E2C01_011844 [Portunus trituberculatus]|uniref:Uncharacterized protein n=1 Tax=Portunus trituberculatus TaxID=210409 RepID=A0A5B7DD26_PORTR|nr:hypothetical protein [Portunus trituberculatus]
MLQLHVLINKGTFLILSRASPPNTTTITTTTTKGSTVSQVAVYPKTPFMSTDISLGSMIYR